MTTPQPFEFTREGRSWATLGAVAFTWLACLIGYLALDAAGWIVALILAFTAPALWDLWSGTRAGTQLSSDGLNWFSGSQSVDVPLPEIEHVRLVTRVDFSVRAAVVLKSGRKLRIPAEATPPHKSFETALSSHGIVTQRHHFSPL